MMKKTQLPLYKKTLALAANLPSSVHIEDVCKAAGSTYRWWHMVQSGHIADPGVHRIQALHDALVEHGATLTKKNHH